MKVNLVRKKRSRKNLKHEKKLEELTKRSSLEPLFRRERTFVWSLRKKLKNEGRYLLLFMKSVDWDNREHRIEAEKLINEWKEPLEYSDALHFLGSNFEGNGFVRNYGLKILSKVDDEILIDIILPLVECFNYEKQIILEEEMSSSLLSFLIDRSVCNFCITNFFEWSLKSKVEDKAVGNLYQKIHDKFHEELLKRNPQFFEWLNHQKEFVNRIRTLKLTLTNEKKKGKRKRNRKYLNSVLQGELESKNWVEFMRNNRIRSPLHPELELCTFVSEKSTILKNMRYPLYLVLQDSHDIEHPMIFYEDSNEHIQDNFFTSLVSTCDRILKENGMDFNLITYRVTSSSSDSFVEVISNSSNLVDIEITKKKKSSFSSRSPLQSWLSVKCGNNPEEMKSSVDRFIRSCAGYSTITYLFGVGDRHFENIRVSDDGRLYHIDFAFILGHDPKPTPSKIRLSEDMIKLIKSVENGWGKFVDYCCDAYIVLRRYSSLFEQIFILMSENQHVVFHNKDKYYDKQYDSSSSISISSIRRHEKMIQFLISKFRHGVSDEEARKCMEMILEEEVNHKEVVIREFFSFALKFRD